MAHQPEFKPSDTIAEFGKSIRHKFMENPEPFYMGAGVVVLIIIAAVIGLMQLQNTREDFRQDKDEAIILYHRALTSSQSEDVSQYIKNLQYARETINNFISKYPARKQTVFMRLYSTMLEYELAVAQGNNADIQHAQESFRQFVEKYPNHILTPRAAFNIGQTYEQLGNMRAARSNYQYVQEQYTDSSLIAEAGFNIGVTYEAEMNYHAAMLSYKKVIDNYDDSPWKIEAQKRLALLTYRYGNIPEPVVKSAAGTIQTRIQ